MLVSLINQGTSTREKDSKAEPGSQLPLDKIFRDLKKADPQFYAILTNNLNLDVMSEGSAKIEAKQFMLNVLRILKGSDSALKERLNRLLPVLFNTVVDEPTSKLAAQHLKEDSSLVRRQISRIEGKHRDLKNLSIKSAMAA